VEYLLVVAAEEVLPDIPQQLVTAVLVGVEMGVLLQIPVMQE